MDGHISPEQEAETAASLCLANIATMENQISEINGKMENLSPDDPAYSALANAAAKLAAEVAAIRSWQEESKNVADMRNVHFKDTEVAGDPVHIFTGNFLADYVDFKARDGITGFEVKRKYSAAHSAESFGSGWICPFDSRIIRARPDDVMDCRADINKAIELCDKGMESASKYISTYGDRFPSEKINQAFERMKGEKEKYEKLKEAIEKQLAENALIDELNSFVTYGDYGDRSQFKGAFNQFIFVNENGDSILFHYAGGGLWIPYETAAAQKMTVYGLKEDGSPSDSIDCPGGYKILFASGDQTFYSKYGLMTKKICPNGNVTIFDCGAKKDGSIILPTGEQLRVSRNNNNLIERIEGSVSGFTEYVYSEKKLVSVLDNEGIRVNFSYDSKNNLKEIHKADGKSVKLIYEFNSAFQKEMCVCVTDENGNSEYFSYTPAAGQVTHRTVDGGSEVFRYNNRGITVYKRAVDGTESYYYPDEKGCIERKVENGLSKNYSYDSSFRISGVTYGSGGSESYSYSSNGKVSKITDSDGFSNSWNYDSRGNLTESYFNEKRISSCSYYSNGLLKSLEENSKKIEFSYNQYGYISSKTTLADGKSLSESWEYDSKCRVSKYKDIYGVETKITYPDLFSRIEISGNQKKTERHFNERLFEIETIETDLKSGISYKKNVEYDGRGNPLKIWMNGKLLCEYEYMPSGKLKAYSVQGVRTEYLYDNAGRILEEKRKIQNGEKSGQKNILPGEYIISSASYRKSGNNLVVNVIKNGKAIQYIYNNRGFLIKESFPGGAYRNYSYTDSGRLESISDSCMNLYRRTYFRDGSYSDSQKNYLQNSRKLDFSQRGLIKASRDFMGNETYYKYDSFCNLLEESSPACLKKYTYDKYSRPSGFSIIDFDGSVCLEEEYLYNYEQKTLLEKCGGKNKRTLFYDCWERPVKIISGEGELNLDYDALGNCIRIFDGKREALYEYSPFGSLASKVIKSGEGRELYRMERSYNLLGACVNENQMGNPVFSCEFDSAGRVKVFENNFGNSFQYDYDDDGNIKSLISGSGGKTSFSKNSYEFSIINGEKSKYSYVFNPSGSLLMEESPLGKKKQYEYDRNGRLMWQTGFSGNRQLVNRNYSDGSCSIDFYNGEKFFIRKNPLGMIKKIDSDFSSVEYEYDRGGRLSSFRDLKNNIEVFYAYDDYGRCISKKTKNNEFSYLYNSEGLLKEISEGNSSFYVQFFYDDLKREVLRHFSNGVEIKSGYNDKGLKSFSESRDSLGNLICADYIIYDDKNRIQYVCDKNCNIKHFSYDNKGRLLSATFPYSEEICLMAKKEVLDCGLYLKSDHPDGKNVNFEGEGIASINRLLQTAGNSARVPQIQYSWIEKYDYTATGAVKSVENPFGKINYEYDAFGRLMKKYSSNSKDEGMSFFWNEDNCLEKISGKNTEVLLSYGAMLRPVIIIQRDKISGNALSFEYRYDALGRRIYEKTASGMETALLYDGSGNNLLMKIPLRQNGVSDFSGLYAANNNAEGAYDFSGYSEGEGVKTGIFENAHSGARAGYNLSEKVKNTGRINEIEKSFQEDNRVCLFLNLCDGSSVRFYTGSGGLSDIDLVTADFRGNATAVFSGSSECSSLMEYDVWGNTIKSGENEKFSGSTGKNRSAFLFYNLSSRDYCPELKCFTSMDAAKDGANWFSFCSCDPVNFYDSTGFTKNSLTDKEAYDYACAIISLAYEFSVMNYYTEGNSYFIPSSFDCADVSYAMDCLASMYAGLEANSEKAAAFRSAFAKGDVKGAAAAVCSSDFFGVDSNAFIKTSAGFDRDLLANFKTYFNEHGNYKDVPAYISEMRNRADAISALRNPNIVTPGTVLVWSKSDNPADRNKNWEGHTLTVVARTFDDKGYVTGFAYIEGHTGGGKTRVGYMNITTDYAVCDYDGNVYTIDSWCGNFLGTYKRKGGEYVKAGCEK